MITILSFTQNGAVLGERIRVLLERRSHIVETFAKYPFSTASSLSEPVGTLTARLFACREALIFVGAAGIAVRAIAPCVERKDRDPAVLVIDETGRFVIPILSGHIGGANALATEIAEMLCAVPVLTTATDRNHCFAVDSWAMQQGLAIVDTMAIKTVSAALLRGETVSFHCDAPILSDLPPGIRLSDEGEVGIHIGEYPKPEFYPSTLNLIPRVYAVGIGCRKGIDTSSLRLRVMEVLAQAGILPESLWCIASIDLKREEEAILRLVQEWRLPFRTYSAEELKTIPGNFQPSQFVQSVTGVDNVCERAAIAAIREDSREPTLDKALNAVSPAELVVRKQAGSGITIAIAKRNWRCRF